ncbi:MAG: peptide chain release factor N(5)-glutamine methyltransferase [Candidatus Marinimicrobia bacterium]|nr:peptide chain release factor N(5)-glutamine methyltransferase [Candidatus Neomarinimicrobiota bacterium]MBL7023293.1 peptide chain release factor N(5)-glutamine methyltransferase [Candidatus Neomarinimicrobiota bacterium]
MPKIWRVIDLIDWGVEYFQSKNISNARLETEWLLCDVLECKRIDLYVRFEQSLSQTELSKFKSFILRRIKGEPFQHIIGKAPFYGRDFIVNRDVLIPRPETEIIIDITKQNNISPNKILDIGTGSGCLAITLALENPNSEVIATDVSEKALMIAKENAHRFKLQNINFFQHNFLKENFSEKFDLIVSNPPYIATDEIENLQPEVKDYDPTIALTDGKDGLIFYRRFSEMASVLINENGKMLLEFGGNQQVEAVSSIFTNDDFVVKFHRDLQNEQRVIEISFTND